MTESDCGMTTDLVLYRPPALPRAVNDGERDLRTETDEYLLFKRKRLTAKSARGYRTILTEFCTAHLGYLLSDFHPPSGGELVEVFLERRYGHLAGRTYNKSFSCIHNFFDWELRRGRIPADPMLMLEKAKVRPYHRTTFTDLQRAAVILATTDPRERIAQRLLFDYGLRKGALQNVQLEHFDVERRWLTIFTKGETIHEIPIPDAEVWDDLDGLIDGEPGEHFLIPKQRQRRRRPPHHTQLLRLRDLLHEALDIATAAISDPNSSREAAELASAIDLAAGWLDRTAATASTQIIRYLEEPIGEHGMHDLWYRWLARAGIVAEGVTFGQRMHKARHTAGQRLLDLTGNLKAVQVLLGHASINTTGDAYTGWETMQLEADMRGVIAAKPVLTDALNARLSGERSRV